MKNQLLMGLALALLALVHTVDPTDCQAGIVSVDQSAFSGSEMVVDFNTPFIDETLFTNQFSGLGVTFSGGLYTLQEPVDTALFPANGGGQIASNWLYSEEPGLQTTVIDIYFANPVNRVGFWREMWPIDTLTVTAFSGTASLGSVSFAGGFPIVYFTGVEDLSTSFDRIQLAMSGPDNNFLAIDDLRFEAASVPEPASLTLLVSGLGIMGLMTTRRRNSRRR